MDQMTPYERLVRQEIDDWKVKDRGVVGRALAPLGRWLDAHVLEHVPNALMSTVERGILGFMDGLFDLSNYTFSDEEILADIRQRGIPVGSIRELRHQDMEDLDDLARSHFRENKLTVALTGAGCGLGGLALIAVDIPTLFGVAFRAVQQVGTCYGFDMNDPRMRPIALQAFSAGTAGSAIAKATAMADMRTAAVAFGKNWTYKQVAERTMTGVVAQFLKEQTKYLPKQIANQVTKASLSKMIPIAGSAIGAGYNYWFLGQVTYGSYMVFRDLWLFEKYEHPDLYGSGPAGASQCRGRTRNGVRCRRPTRHPSGLCSVHRSDGLL